MKITKLKIFRIPYFNNIHNDMQQMKCENYPPLALGTLTSYLRSKQFNIDQDDLHIKTRYDNLYDTEPLNKVDGDIFYDIKRILSYLTGKDDKYLDDNINNILKKTTYAKYDLILLSSPPGDISALLSTLLIAYGLKQRCQSRIVVGGASINYYWLLGLRLKIIDYIILGPGELALEHLINTLKNDGDFLMHSSAEKAVESIAALAYKYNTKYFFFVNTGINCSKAFINSFCDEIIKKKLDILWVDCANFINLDSGILHKMKKAGALRLIWGPETASPRLLKYIHKNVDPHALLNY